MHASTHFPRSAGILLHPTSLPGKHGIGDLGAGAFAFVDWLKQCGMQRWQVLPLVPAGPGGSPYSSATAFSLNPALVDLIALKDAGLLHERDLDIGLGPPHFDVDACDYARVLPWKAERLHKAAEAFVRDSQGKARVDRFRVDNPWVDDWALFVALKKHNAQQAWWQWDPALSRRDATALAKAQRELADTIAVTVAEQVLVDEQWQRLRAHCRRQGVSIIGDIPIYVDLDSVDVWANRDQFLLKPDGAPMGVAGVPPDAFTELGQLWGNPLYDWKRMKDDGYRWWIARMRRVLSLTDVVRIDHFRAFAAYWAVPHGDKDARGGQWVKGPGLSLFTALQQALASNTGGKLPVILEDLGVITDDVEELRDATGLPGMRVLQFAWGQGPTAAYLPHNHAPNSVIYTGTHDNETSLGFWLGAPDYIKDHVRRYLGIDGNDFVWDFVRCAFSSVAHTAIVPMQDVLALDNGARMNMPGSDTGNWRWRVRVEAFHDNLARRLKALAELYGRLPEPPRAASTTVGK